MGKPFSIPHSKGSRDGKRARLRLVAEIPEEETREGGVVIPFPEPRPIPVHGSDLSARYVNARKKENRVSSVAEAFDRYRKKRERMLRRATCASERAVRGR